MSSTKKVLIVEDERPVAKSLANKLASEGIEVSVAEDGNEALEQLREGIFDYILLDLIMPDMDGFEVLEHLQRSGKDIPVTVLTNLSQEEDIQRVKKLGVKHFFVKSNTSLTQIVDHVKAELKK